MKLAIYGNKPRDPQKRDEVVAMFSSLVRFADAGVQLTLEERYSSYLLRYAPEAGRYPTFPATQPPLTDIALSIGGDGTFLRTANSIGKLRTPIIGINSGHLGYLSAARLSEMPDVMEQLLNNRYTVEPRSVLAVSSPDTGLRGVPCALNEVAIIKQDTASMINVSTVVGPDLPLAEYRADGLIISTPTGSTGYNLSVGGPVVAPDAPVWVISPIAAHALSMRPLVVSDSVTIDATVTSRSGSYLLSIDGKSRVLDTSARLHIERAPWEVNVIHLQGQNFPQTLRTKLLWGIS